MVNIYIAYEINLWSFNVGKGFALENSFSRFFLEQLSWLKMLILISINILAMVLDLMQVEVFHYQMVVGLVKMWYLVLTRVHWFILIIRKNISWFLSLHIENLEKDILILGNSPTDGLDSTLTAEKAYYIKFTAQQNKFCLSLHYNGVNSYTFINGVEIFKLKANNFQTNAALLCLGNVSKGFSESWLWQYWCWWYFR